MMRPAMAEQFHQNIKLSDAVALKAYTGILQFRKD